MEDFFLKYIISKVYSIWSLLFGLIIAIIVFAAVDNLIEKILSDVIIRFLIYAIISLLWVLYWSHYRFCLPRNKKNKVGLVIAIYTESKHEENRLKHDLISQLQKIIFENGFKDIINIITIKNHISEKIQDVDTIKDIHKKVRGHFYLYGRVRRRNDGEKTYFLDLNGLVIHIPIDIRLSADISKDFISVLPKQISFLEAMEFKGFQFTANVVYLAVKYIVGVAAYISYDPFLAVKFHSNLKDEFNKYRPLPPNLQRIRDRANMLLSEEQLIIARLYFIKGELSNYKIWIDESFRTNQNNYGGFLLQAIKEFQIDKDPLAALNSIKNAKKYSKNDFSWRYSEAFLKFWLGDYAEAIKICQKIVNSSYAGENLTIAEVEKFNHDLLSDANNNKPQLYFWLGYINYKKKNNLPESLKYFEEFEKKSTSAMAVLIQKSSAYLQEIRKTMEITKI